MSEPRIGFIGLGNMGGPMAGNLVKAGRSLIVFDAAGTESRAPEGAAIAGSAAEIAQAAELVLLSLPDGKAVAEVAAALRQAEPRQLETVVDTSTTGISEAQAVQRTLTQAGIAFYDAPVSGGTAGARAGSIAMMFAGPAEAHARVQPLFAGMVGRVFHVGSEPGQGQAMKLLNNFLSGIALGATSEAVAFGLAQGLEMGTMLEVLNASTGQNTATLDKFPNRIMNERYDAGFTNTLLLKDLKLYRAAVEEAGTAAELGALATELWQRFQQAEPGADFTRIFPFLRDGR